MRIWFFALWLAALCLTQSVLSEHLAPGMTAHENAIQLAADGRFGQAEKIVREQLRILRTTAPDDTVGLIAAHTNLALMLVFQNKLTAAETEAMRALRILELGNFEEQTTIRCRIESVLGKIDFYSERYRAAEEHFSQVLRISTSAGSRRPQDIAVVLNDLALSVAAQGEYDRALSFVEDAVQTLRTARLTGDAEYGRVVANLGIILLRTKQWTKADTAYREAISVMSSHLSPADPHLGITLAEHSHVLEKLGHKAEAKAVRKRALTILRSSSIGSSIGRTTVDVRALRR